MKRLLIIIPTYNEKKNIKKIFTEINSLLPGFDHLNIELLIVDDNSPDNTGGYTLELKKEFNFINLLQREKKQGLGRSYLSGIEWGVERKFDYFLLMDGDGSHSCKYIKDFVRYLEDGYEYITGSRYLFGVSVVNWSITRLFLSYSANKFIRFILGIPLKDVTSGFKAFNYRYASEIIKKKIKSTGYAFHFETTFIAYISKFKMKEFPIIFIERRWGRSKLSKKIMFESFFRVFFLKFRYLFKKS
ncbi:MAG: polyprenol monophosphomannose synthase [bacterium]|nr:polyprenol monophosphomannose synthase [bacterium]